MLTREVLLDEQWIHRQVRVDAVGYERHLGYLFHDDGIVDGVIRILTPREWTVILYQYTGSVDGVDFTCQNAVHNDDTCLFLVLSHLVGCHVTSARDGIVEVVGVSSANVGNVEASLSPCSSIGRMGVDDAAQLREGLI